MFLFHNIDNKIYKLNDNLYNKNINILIFKDFENQLSINKEKIDSIDKYIWNSSKKKQNIYELIYTSSNNINKNICDFIPVSRSYYKLIEMIHSQLSIKVFTINTKLHCKFPLYLRDWLQPDSGFVKRQVPHSQGW